MLKQILICDKCGKEVPEERYQMNGLDFCDIHKNELIDMIQAWIDSPEEAGHVADQEVKSEEATKTEVKKKVNKTAEKNRGKKYNTKRTTGKVDRHGIAPVRKGPIDWDKVCALRTAGWSVAAICEEMHLNHATLNTALAKHMKEYTERKANEKPGKTYYERNYGGDKDDWSKGGKEFGKEDSGMDKGTTEETEECVG